MPTASSASAMQRAPGPKPESVCPPPGRRAFARTIEGISPDADGIKLLTGRTAAVGLGHCRLSIIDLAGGRQPMSNEDGTIWISYNGEIYNHLALREELSALVLMVWEIAYFIRHEEVRHLCDRT